jgi:hypothetical protein
VAINLSRHSKAMPSARRLLAFGRRLEPLSVFFVHSYGAAAVAAIAQLRAIGDLQWARHLLRLLEC